MFVAAIAVSIDDYEGSGLTVKTANAQKQQTARV